MSSTTKVYLSGSEEEMINELKAFVCLCSMKLFDRWNNVVHLHLDKMNITSDVYSLLTECLELPLAKDPTGSSNEKRRWIHMTMENTHFTHDDICNEQGGDYIDKDEAQSLCAAIADQALRLKITRSEGFLTAFLDTPEVEHLSVDTLHIDEGHRLSAQQYAKLGKLIATTVQLRDLYLSVAVADGAQELFDGFANAINLQKLTLHDCNSTDGENSTENRQAAELIIGDNGPLIRLLQNPLNQLKELCLTKLGLNDQHLIALSQVLPTCQIEVFDVCNNLIESEGIFEFGRQLPRMHSLKHVRFGSNPWEDSETTSNTFGAALLQGIMENTSIESMDSDALYYIRQRRPVWHYLVLNRAGRRLLASSQPIPDGLWPLVLERAGDGKRYKSVAMHGGSGIDGELDDWIINLKGTARYNAVYFLCTSLQRHSPYCSKQQLEEREMPASKHPRLVTNNDEKSVPVDHVAPREEDVCVPCWAQNMEQRLVASLRAVEQGVQQLKNRGLVQATEKLTPVIRLEDGRIPDVFPATIVDLEHSEEDRVVELLRFYGLADNVISTEKTKRLKNFLGTNL